MPTPQLTATQRRIIGTIAAGAVLITGIGFTGSYTAVRQLALTKGFGTFANVFPIGIDAGIAVLLALDLLLTWLRIPFPLLRHTAWALTAATIAFNAASAWPDLLGVGMHAVIPVLFVVIIEAARHAVGRIADITADRRMEPVRATRWLLAPFPTFRLWRRMKLWELRSYDEVIRLEQQRLVYRAQLRARYGRMWRWAAPVEAVMPLRLARLGVSLPAVPAANDAPRRLTVICSGPTGTLTVRHPASPAASPAAALPAAPEPTTSSEAPQPRITICGGHIAALTVPPHLRKKRAPKPVPAGVAVVMRPAQRAAARQQRNTVAPPQPHRPTAAAPDAFDSHANDALRLAGLSKAAAVRAVRDAFPTDAAPRIVERLAAQGITATDSYVRTVLSRDSRTRRDTTGTGQYL